MTETPAMDESVIEDAPVIMTDAARIARKKMDLLRHKKAHLNYEILEQFEAGIELSGGEVKSLRAHQGSLEGAHVVVRGGEAFLIGATIPPYQPANTDKGYDPERPRLKRAE